MVHFCKIMISAGLIFIYLKFSSFRLLGGGGEGGEGGGEGKKGPRSQKHSIWCTSYLRNHISYNCHLWYTCVKWWYCQVFFSFFKILILWVVVGGGGGGFKRAKNGPKWEKIVFRAPYLKNHTSCDFHLGYSCLKW